MLPMKTGSNKTKNDIHWSLIKILTELNEIYKTASTKVFPGVDIDDLRSKVGELYADTDSLLKSFIEIDPYLEKRHSSYSRTEMIENTFLEISRQSAILKRYVRDLSSRDENVPKK